MTEISRRALLRAGVFGVVLVPAVSARPAFGAAGPANLYIRSRFTPLLNAAFKMVGTTSSWSATLLQISDLPPAASGDKYRFGLTFRTPVAGPPQGSYTFRRSGFTATTLFVVPTDASRRSYQAVINRA